MMDSCGKGESSSKESHNKRLSYDSPSTAISPSVRASSKKLTRLSKTPSRRDLEPVKETNSDIVSLAVKESEDMAMNGLSDGNIEESLVEETSTFGQPKGDKQAPHEATNKESIKDDSMGTSEQSTSNTITEKEMNIESSTVAMSDGDLSVGAEIETPLSIAAMLSPGMSDEMKAAIKTYLKAEPDRDTSYMDAQIVENVAPEDTNIQDVLNRKSKVCESTSKFTAVEENSESFGNEKELNNDEDPTEVIFRQQYTRSNTEDHSENLEVLQTENSTVSQIVEDDHEGFMSSFNSNLSVTETEGYRGQTQAEENYTLSIRKRKVLEACNRHLDELSTPEELARYGRERVEDYSFLINEAYCEKSVFCENCYAMRLELALFADKFSALAATNEGGRMVEGGNKSYMDELDKLLRKKDEEMLKLTTNVTVLLETNSRLTKEKEVAVKDAESYKFLLEEEMKNRHNEVCETRQKMELELKEKMVETEDKMQSEINQLKLHLETVSQQLVTLSKLHEHDQLLLEELESGRKKVIDEKEELSSRLQRVLEDLENLKRDQRMSNENSRISDVSLLENKITELGRSINEAIRRKEDEGEMRLFLLEKLTSTVENFKAEVKENVYGKWDATDTLSSLIYFETVINIILQSTPQFEMLIETVAQHRETMKNELKQYNVLVEQAVAEKVKWETLFATERSKFDGLQGTLSTHFSENRKCFMDLFQDFQKSMAEKLCSLMQVFTDSQSKEDFEREVSIMLKRITTNQENSSNEWVKATGELHESIASLEEQRRAANASMKSELQKMSGEVATLQRVVEKILTNSSTLLDSYQKVEENALEETEQKKQLETLKSELEELKWERATLKVTCEHGEQLQQELQKQVEFLQGTTKDLRLEIDSERRNLDYERENVTRAFRVAENLTAEKDQLASEIAILKDRILKFEEESSEWKEKRILLAEQAAKIEELEDMVRMLERENERMKKACDDADTEVGGLREQLFELLQTNVNLGTGKNDESVAAINQKIRYTASPPQTPSQPLSVEHKIHSISPAIESVVTAESLDVMVTNATESPPKSKLGMKVEKVFASKAEVAEEVLTKRLPGGGSPQLKTDRDGSCRTS